MRRVSLSAVIVLALLLSACQSAPPEYPLNARVPADQVTEEAVEGEGEGTPEDAFVAVFTAGADLAYSDFPPEVPAGPVVVALELTANAQHNVVIEGFNGDNPLAEGSAEGEYVSDQAINLDPGSYYFYCSVPTHQAAGMEGDLTVIDGPAPAAEGAGDTDGAEGEGAEGDGADSAAPEGDAAEDTDEG